MYLKDKSKYRLEHFVRVNNGDIRMAEMAAVKTVPTMPKPLYKSLLATAASELYS